MNYTDPHWDSSALVTIDVQSCTLAGGALEVAGTSDAVAQIVELATAFRSAGQPIVHAVRLYHADGSDVDLCRRAEIEAGATFLVPGQAGTELVAGLVAGDPPLDVERLLSGEVQEVGPGECVVWKPRWGAFYRTRLEGHLRSLGCDTLVFCGANFPNCPRTSIYEASERDFRVVAASDGISGIYARGARELGTMGATLLRAREIIGALENERGAVPRL